MDTSVRIATVHEIKEELQTIPAPKLIELCLRLSRFKKENKELLTFLLFEAHDLEGYTKAVQKSMADGFDDMNSSNLYFAKKTIRKVLRIANRHIRFTGSKQVEVELLLYFCELLFDSGLPLKKNNALFNLYSNQLKKAEKTSKALHEDLQYEYARQIEKLKAVQR
ncbi:hypothetical protein [Pollutibacter soli]|uniref:hypothetical protein n=1 Tax=Pollutibacter soli TaxID=3034157 RepID=UPI003013B75C